MTEPADFEHRAIALLRHLETMDKQWLAVRVDGTGWNVVQPRTQEALLAACETDPQAGIELVAAHREAGARAAQEALVAWLDACWPAGSGSDFNQGVVRGFEIVRAQAEAGHITRFAARMENTDG